MVFGLEGRYPPSPFSMFITHKANFLSCFLPTLGTLGSQSVPRAPGGCSECIFFFKKKSGGNQVPSSLPFPWPQGCQWKPHRWASTTRPSSSRASSTSVARTTKDSWGWAPHSHPFTAGLTPSLDLLTSLSSLLPPLCMNGWSLVSRYPSLVTPTLK